MMDFAYYRLPDTSEYHVISGEAESISSIDAIAGRSGFVLAPFLATADHPVVFIPATTTDVRSVDASPSSSVVNPAAAPAAHTGDDAGTPLRATAAATERQAYHHDFALVHRCLDDGDADKVVLARRHDLAADAVVDVEAAFHRACRRYPHQMIILVSTAVSGTWLMATPEVLIEGRGQRWRTVALAGTMTADGPWSAKNRREQHIVEEYVGDCLHRHATDIELSAPHTVTAGGLFHICTDFVFDLPADRPALSSLIDDLYPTPAVCGLPKAEARSIILNSETADRRYYSGFAGPVAIGGATHLFVSLRCMEVSGRRVSLYAGGGLLSESREDDEWKETEEKLRTMKDVL